MVMLDPERIEVVARLSVLLIRRDVAQLVADSIVGKLTSVEKARLASGPPVDPAAYDAYLRGMYFLWVKPRRREAASESDRAIAFDRAFAPAYAQLAVAKILLMNNLLVPTREALPAVQSAAQKALDLDPELGEGWMALAAAREQRWAWAEAESA